jgi:hypothetical protein
MIRFTSLRLVHFVAALAVPSFVLACGDDQNHGPTIGAPTTPVVITEGGGSTGVGGTGGPSGGTTASGGGAPGAAGTLTGIGGTDPFGVGGSSIGGGAPFGSGGGSDPFTGTTGGSPGSFSGTTGF